MVGEYERGWKNESDILDASPTFTADVSQHFSYPFQQKLTRRKKMNAKQNASTVGRESDTICEIQLTSCLGTWSHNLTILAIIINNYIK